MECILLSEEPATGMNQQAIATLDNKEDEDENDWTQFQEFHENELTSEAYRRSNSMTENNYSNIAPLPQLHPAVSLGMQTVSSCYFSIVSNEGTGSIEGSMGDVVWGNNNKDDTYKTCCDLDNDTDNDVINRSIQFDTSDSSDDILYHDILMNVFTYLDAQSLASFSETARRPNFEVFYFLQLQLQRSLLVDASPFSQPNHSDQLTAIAGSAILSRLAKLEPSQAQSIVDAYFQCNSSLQRMPLSHSIAYMRHFLKNNGFHNHLADSGHPSQALASAALLATVVGAAYVSGEMPQALSSGELPNLLLRFGFVGSLMGAARQMSDGDVRVPTLFEMKETLTAALRDSNASHHRNSKLSPTDNTDIARPMLSNPYDHHSEDEKGEEEKIDLDAQEHESHVEQRKMPSGCMGAYSRAIHSATSSIVQLVKQRRQNRYDALPPGEQEREVSTLLDACSSNEGLATVKELSHIMDLDAFYVGSDGSETCALHTAAFHGASDVVDFLLQGIDDSDPNQDGGLCLVDFKDSNGWTALHFAAGSNSLESVQVLANHGAKLSLEANNGYSPLQWARRLSNEEVEEALQELIQNESSNRTMGWKTQRLTSLANRFFSLIPSR